MNIDKLILAINDVALLHGVSLEEIQLAVDTYPFFSIGQMLLVKKMQQSKHLLLKKEIKKTAVVVPDRKRLYTFLYKKEIQTQLQKAASHESAKPEVSPKETAKEEIKTDDTTSSFKVPVSIFAKAKTTSTFSKSIDLKSLGDQKTKELDLLEQQIIGQTIEHVLAQEIEKQFSIFEPEQKNSEKSENNIPNDKQKFSDWLTILDQDRLKAWRNKETQVEEKSSEHELSESDIINSFLSKNTKIITQSNPEAEFTPSNLARLSIVDDEDFVTETLADIYAKQGNINKAIKAYQKLLLKYPEKKTYFAARIEKLEQDLK